VGNGDEMYVVTPAPQVLRSRSYLERSYGLSFERSEFVRLRDEVDFEPPDTYDPCPDNASKNHVGSVEVSAAAPGLAGAPPAST